jgi:hypothetical protein
VSGANPVNFGTVTASCSAGKKVIGGGYSFQSSNGGEPYDGASPTINYDDATPDHSGWQVALINPQNNPPSAAITLIVTVHAICAQVP